MQEHMCEDFQLGHLNCSLLKTADGSFSLRYRSTLFKNEQWTEPMHSSKGAWSETLHVYLPALIESMALPLKTEPWKVASIGLGLGYNEILSAALAYKHGTSSDQLKIFSFESEHPLQLAFKTFLLGSEQPIIPAPLTHAYENILDLVCSYLNLDTQSLMSYMRLLLESGSLELHGQVDTKLIVQPNKSVQQSHCVLFDAFSPESSPLLWEVQLLDAIVVRLCAPSCRFVSYASRTVLKRVLVSNGFRLSKKPGFAGKRECTFATRSALPDNINIKKD